MTSEPHPLVRGEEIVADDLYLFQYHPDEGELTYIYVCEICGQPLRFRTDVCTSSLHMEPSQGRAGNAITSTELARRLANAFKDKHEFVDNEARHRLALTLLADDPQDLPSTEEATLALFEVQTIARKALWPEYDPQNPVWPPQA